MKACWKEDAQAVASEPQEETGIEAVHTKSAFSDQNQSIVYLIRKKRKIFKKHSFFGKNLMFGASITHRISYLW
jgi:hypothetical protein